MSAFPCNNKVDCECPDFPFENYSSEAEDPFLFYGTNYGGPWDTPPPHGNRWTALGCKSICVSEISQQDADLCAQRQQVECDGVKWNPQPPIFFNVTVSCSVRCPDGLPFTFTVAPGQFAANTQIIANRSAESYACRQARLRRVCLGELGAPQCCIGTEYSQIIQASGNFLQGAVWDIVDGSLPPGLTMFGFEESAKISGTPDTAGQFDFSIQITELSGDYMLKNYTICVIGISPTTLPDGKTGTDYNQTLTAPTCTAIPLSWQITDGALPDGLSLDEETGKITGKPTVSASFRFTVTLQTEAT